MNVRPLADLFEENFLAYGELGSSISVWHRGEEVWSAAAGFQDPEKTRPWTKNTRVLIWSATKGLTSACLIHACTRHGLSLERRVAMIWPDYATRGKEDTTLLHVLSHQAGQPALRDTTVSVFDHDGVARALAAQEPFWQPGQAHGYHSRTYGFLIDELLRRITGGVPVGAYFRQVFGEPLGLDLWIGIPEDFVGTVAPVRAPRRAASSPEENSFYQAFADPASLTRKAFSTPAGLPTPSSMNDPKVQRHMLPSFGGIGTADSLARFYAGICEPGIFDRGTLDTMSTLVVSGEDQVLHLSTGFGAGFMKDPVLNGKKQRELFGPSIQSFGQPGAGGSHAFADPENNLAFAYVMNQMEPGVFPNEKSLRIVRSLYACCL
jgi:CubicO group peptidase (beta-lactamase class C family)